MKKRQAHYCKRVMETICEYLAKGMTLKAACKKAGELAPNAKTVWKWRMERPELEAMYQEALDKAARARREALDAEAGKMIQRIIAVETAPIPPRPAAHWASALFMGVE